MTARISAPALSRQPLHHPSNTHHLDRRDSSSGQSCHTPSLETLVKISQILRVSLDDLVFGKTEINNNMIKILALTLEEKDPEKVKVFLKTVCALANKLDEF